MYSVTHRYNGNLIGGTFPFSEIAEANQFVNYIVGECSHLEGTHQIELVDEDTNELVRLEYFGGEHTCKKRRRRR